MALKEVTELTPHRRLTTVASFAEQTGLYAAAVLSLTNTALGAEVNYTGIVRLFQQANEHDRGNWDSTDSMEFDIDPDWRKQQCLIALLHGGSHILTQLTPDVAAQLYAELDWVIPALHIKETQQFLQALCRQWGSEQQTEALQAAKGTEAQKRLIALFDALGILMQAAPGLRLME